MLDKFIKGYWMKMLDHDIKGYWINSTWPDRSIVTPKQFFVLLSIWI